MKLFTFQNVDCLEQIEKNGFYQPLHSFHDNKTFENNKEFFYAYEWMKNQMLKRGIECHENLIWCWHSFNGYQNIDKRLKCMKNFAKKPFIGLELELNSSRALLSDFDAWHYVLNYWHLGSEEESEEIEKVYNYFKNKPEKSYHLIDNGNHHKIVKSWELIFNLEACQKLLGIDKHDCSIQATIGKINKEDIIKVHYFQ